MICGKQKRNFQKVVDIVLFPMKNVINDDGTKIFPPVEPWYTYKIIIELKKILPDFNNYLFIFYNHNGTTLPISRNFKHDKKILFWEAGENKQQQFNKIKSDYLCIFTHYAKSHGKIHSFPLGYFKNELNSDVIEMSERFFNISFTGCLNRNRLSLASILSGKPKRYLISKLINQKKKTLDTINSIVKLDYNNDYFQFNEDFNTGLNTERYLYFLKNSKIILCPRGWLNTETFRMYEAMRYGCVVITEKLPNRDYYKNIPVIQVDNWKDGLKIARQLLQDKEKLAEMGKENQEFYKNHFDPKVVAKNISLLIKRLGNKKKFSESC